MREFSNTANENLLSVNAQEPELVLLEIYHPDNPVHIRLCLDSNDFVGFGHTWQHFQFGFTLPDDKDQQFSYGQLIMANIGAVPLNPETGLTFSRWLDDANGGRGVKARFIQTFRSDPFIEFDHTFDVDGIKVDQQTVTGQLAFNKQAQNNHAVARFFTPEWAPGTV